MQIKINSNFLIVFAIFEQNGKTVDTGKNALFFEQIVTNNNLL